MTAVAPKRFAFTKETMEKVHKIQKKYPYFNPRAKSWAFNACFRILVNFLNMPFIKVWEVVSFYLLFHTKPVGDFCIQICTTTPCWLRGSADVMRMCQKWLGINPSETTVDGLFTLQEVYCLGACANGPVIRINEEYTKI